jgi:hypothetical protein
MWSEKESRLQEVQFLKLISQTLHIFFQLKFKFDQQNPRLGLIMNVIKALRDDFGTENNFKDLGLDSWDKFEWNQPPT